MYTVKINKKKAIVKGILVLAVLKGSKPAYEFLHRSTEKIVEETAELVVATIPIVLLIAFVGAIIYFVVKIVLG